MSEVTKILPEATAQGILLDKHVFRANEKGELEHWIGDTLRATVPPEGWQQYAEEWPECTPVVNSLLTPGS